MERWSRQQLNPNAISPRAILGIPIFTLIEQLNTAARTLFQNPQLVEQQNQTYLRLILLEL